MLFQISYDKDPYARILKTSKNIAPRSQESGIINVSAGEQEQFQNQGSRNSTCKINYYLSNSTGRKTDRWTHAAASTRRSESTIYVSSSTSCQRLANCTPSGYASPLEVVEFLHSERGLRDPRVQDPEFRRMVITAFQEVKWEDNGELLQ